ncbi:MAG: 50S ribosomal protein L21 [Bacteroidales bacterium]|nr:50S ribosomal protein L21 [Bacteroidales bacterium]
MYAIVKIAGQQFKVEKGKKIFVHQLPGEVGAEVSFDNVLLVSNNDKVSIGRPYVNNAVVSAQILSHLRGDKIHVFKKKRRKGYQVLNGHRQYFTELLIEEISETGLIKKPAKKKEAETAQDKSQNEAVEITHKEKKSGEPLKSKEKKNGKAGKAKEKEVKKAPLKAGPEAEKTKTVKKTSDRDADMSAASASARRTKETAKTSAGSKTARRKSVETKAAQAVRKAPVKKQGSTIARRPDIKKK